MLCLPKTGPSFLTLFRCLSVSVSVRNIFFSLIVAWNPIYMQILTIHVYRLWRQLNYNKMLCALYPMVFVGTT